MMLTTVVDGLVFPECPRWHDGALFFSDMHDEMVWRWHPDGGAQRVVKVPGRPAGLGWDAGGALCIVSMIERKLLRWCGGEPEAAADLSALATGLTNDMVMDRNGRAYIGNFGFDLNHGEPPRPTVLIAVEPDGRVRVAADDVWFPNGMVITPDGGTLILAETFGSRLTAFDIQPDGSLANRRVFAPLGDLHPDGICLDAEGAVWVTCPERNRVIRVREGGEVAAEIPLPGRDSFACMLGGADGCDLFVCTAPHYLPDITIPARGGRIEMVRVDVPGAGLP